MRVAFTTATGVKVDESFRSTRDFSIWDVSPEGAFYVTTVRVPAGVRGEEEQIAVRADALYGCSLLCTYALNGPAKAKLVARKVQSLRLRKQTSVEDVLGRLQRVVRGNPPPWIRRAMFQ